MLSSTSRSAAGALLMALGPLACDLGMTPRATGSASASASAIAAGSGKQMASCAAFCELAGLCRWSADRERCVAGGDDDCRGSSSCKTSGLCHEASGICIGTGAEDCRGSERCTNDGECTFVERGIRPCAARGDDCAASKECRRKGHCTAANGQCIVATAADCARADACTRDGECSVKEGWRGDVTVRECAALTDDDCKKGTVCTESHHCEAVVGECR